MAADLASPPDYFEALEVPRRLSQDPAVLEKNFYRLSRQNHPDRFTLSSDAERARSLRKMSVLNDAYRTLKDPELRREYFLKLQNVAEPSKANARIPQELAESWFELQDVLVEDPGLATAKITEFQRDLERVHYEHQKKIEDLEAKIDQELGSTGKVSAVNIDELQQAVQHLNYLDSMGRDLERKLAVG